MQYSEKAFPSQRDKKYLVSIVLIRSNCQIRKSFILPGFLVEGPVLESDVSVVILARRLQQNDDSFVDVIGSISRKVDLLFSEEITKSRQNPGIVAITAS